MNFENILDNLFKSETLCSHGWDSFVGDGFNLWHI